MGKMEVVIRLMMIFAVMGIGGKGWGQVSTWDDGTAATAWYTPGNWNPNTNFNAWNSTYTAVFNNTGSATLAGINMSTSSLSIGAIEMTAFRTRNLIIGNSSSTVDAPVSFFGATVNSIARTIIRNSSTFSLTLQDNATGTGKFMGIVLANTTNNIINVDGAGDITIGCIVSGANPLTKSGIGNGVLNLSTGNTYTGKTSIASSFINATGESAFGANPAGFVSDQITLNGGGIQATSGNITFSSNRGITLGTSGGTLNAVTPRTITALNIITGSGPLNVTGAGTGLVLMTGPHTYSGNTTISSGTLQLNRTGGNTIPTSNNLILNGGKLNITTNQTINNLDLNSGILDIAAGVTLTINGTLTYSGGIITTTGTIAYGPSGKIIYNVSKNTGIEWSNSNLPTTVTLNNAAILTLANNVTTSGNLNINNTSRIVGTAFTLTVTGDWNSTSTNASTGAGYTGGSNAASLVVLNGNGTRSLSHNAGAIFRNLNITGTGYYTANNNIDISVNTLNISNGTLDMLTNTLNGSGNLSMSNGTLKLAKLNTILPELTGIYSITGGTIELNGIGIQQFVGSNSFANLTFSNSGTKTLNSAITGANTITGTVLISGSVILDVANRTMGGTGTNLTMTGTSRYINAGISTKPDALGVYSLAPSSSIEFLNTAGSQQDIRLSVNYGNVDISGSNVGLSGPTSVLNMQTGSTFKVTSTGTFNVQNTNGFTGSSTTAINNSNSPTISLNAGSTINYDGLNQAITNTVAYQNLKLSGTGLKTAPFANLLVKGNFTRASSSTFNANTSRVIFEGSTTQNFTDATVLAPIEFYKVTNTNTTNLVINNTFAIQNELNLTPTAKLYVNTGDIIFRSTAIHTAYITDLGTTVPSSNITYGTTGLFNIERYLQSIKSWRFLATPIQSSALSITDSWREAGSLISNGYGTQITGPSPTSIGMDENTVRGSMKWYNKATNNYVEILNTADAIARPQGYYIFVRGNRAQNIAGAGSATNLRMRGRLLTGDQTFSTLAPTGPNDGFESVGNPYPSQINFKTVTKNNIEQSYTVWNPTAGFYGVGRFIQYTSPTINGDYSNAGTIVNTIESGQAFFIQSAVGASGSITIKETDKLAGSNLVSRNVFENRQGVIVPTLEVNLYDVSSNANQPVLDNVVLNFDSSYNNAFEGNDIRKFMNSNDNLAIKNGTRNLIVERRNTLTINDSIFLSLTNTRVAPYRFEIDPSVLGNLPLTAFLKDKFLQTETQVSLTAVTNVIFNITNDAASKVADRFMIVFRNVAAAPLPFRFLTLTAVKKTNKINFIKWKVSNENNINTYNVEKSMNGNIFKKVGSIVGSGSINYSFLDDQLYGEIYYRINAVNVNGQRTYSDTVKLSNELSTKPAFVVTPNPVINKDLIIYFENMTGTVNVQLINNQAATVYNTQIIVISKSEMRSFGLQNNLAAGSYEIVITNNTGNKITQSILIQ